MLIYRIAGNNIVDYYRARTYHYRIAAVINGKGAYYSNTWTYTPK